MLNISILSIGDELCIGQTVNTNSSWIANHLVKFGANIVTHSTIPDEKEFIISEIDRLRKFSEIILVTGGLGPTHDDITKNVLCDYFDDTLILNEEILKLLENYFERRGRSILERHKKQALMPSKAEILPNHVGTAQGMLFRDENLILISMPGVPKEMKYIMENSVFSLIQEKILQNDIPVKIFRTIKTAGIAESDLAELIGDIEFLGDSTLAFLPSYRGVKLRIGVVAYNINSAETRLEILQKDIIKKVGKFVTVIGEEEITETIGKLLREKKVTLSVAESCTGGMLGAAFTDIAGSSDYFMGGLITYSNQAKIDLLNVNPETLEKFGAVSEETAIEMAKNVRLKFNSNFGISITGIAGPDGGSPEKPVGTIWIGLSEQNDTFAKKFVFGNDRAVNRELSVSYALTLIYNRLKNI